MVSTPVVIPPCDPAEWYTPVRVFEALQCEFDLDVASPGREVVPWIPAARHLTKSEDGLRTPWKGFVWMNPPYGLRYGMQAWLDRFAAHRDGIALLPAYTYTRWFHDFIPKCDLILFPLFKLNFIRSGPAQKNQCTMSHVFAAIGEQGCRALRNAERSGFGLCLSRPPLKRLFACEDV